MEAKYGMFITLLKERLEPVPGVLDFIRWAREHYQKIALTTSGKQRVQQVVFAKFGLEPYFDVIVTAEHIQHGKPHPEPYLKTVQALELPAETCLVIEDSLNGIKSAKDAGCKVAGITTSFLKAELLEAGADLVIEDFETFLRA